MYNQSYGEETTYAFAQENATCDYSKAKKDVWGSWRMDGRMCGSRESVRATELTTVALWGSVTERENVDSAILFVSTTTTTNLYI